jgi:RNA polymerase sigma factor (sigma-70 family)
MKTISKGDSVAHAYLVEIGRMPLLTPNQEIDLSRKVQRAYALKALERPLTLQERREVRIGERAEEKFVCSNLRLVVACAKKYSHVTKTMDMLDLIQEGNIGLLRAVQGFEAARGHRFSTYAFWWIRQAITRAIVKKDRTIHMPMKLSEMVANWSIRMEKLQTKLGRKPTHEEIAEAYGLSTADLQLCLGRKEQPMSLDFRSHDDGMSLGDMLTDDIIGDGPLHKMMVEEQFLCVTDAMFNLTERERDIIQRRLGINGHAEHTWVDLGKRYKVSRERARQIYNAATNRLRLQIARAEREADLAEQQPLLAG